jgi:hypothetical protein
VNFTTAKNAAAKKVHFITCAHRAPAKYHLSPSLGQHREACDANAHDKAHTRDEAP